MVVHHWSDDGMVMYHRRSLPERFKRKSWYKLLFPTYTLSRFSFRTCKDYNSKFVFLSQCIVFPKSPFKISVSWSLPFQFVSESGNEPERMIAQTSLKLCRWKTVCCQSTRNSFAAWTISWPGEGVSDDDENNSTGHLHDCFHFRVGQCRGNLSTLYDMIFSV